MAKKSGLPIKKAEGFGKTDTKPISVKIVHDDPSPSVPENRSYEAEERKRKARYALEDIERAEVHKKDKSLMKDVKAHAREKMNALSKVCGK